MTDDRAVTGTIRENTPVTKVAKTDGHYSEYRWNKLDDFVFHFGLKEAF